MGVVARLPEALSLLLASAEMDKEAMDSESDEYRIALEIVELCRRMPLTLAIAGGRHDQGQSRWIHGRCGGADEVKQATRAGRRRERHDARGACGKFC